MTTRKRDDYEAPRLRAIPSKIGFWTRTWIKLLSFAPLSSAYVQLGLFGRALGVEYARRYAREPFDAHDAIVDLAEHFAASLVNGYHAELGEKAGPLCERCRAAGVQPPPKAEPTQAGEFHTTGHCLGFRCKQSLTPRPESRVGACACYCEPCIVANVAPVDYRAPETPAATEPPADVRDTIPPAAVNVDQACEVPDCPETALPEYRFCSDHMMLRKERASLRGN